MKRASCTALLFLVGLVSACSRGEPASPPPAGQLAPLDHIERITGHAAAGDRLPMIVAIHGLGDSPQGFVGLLAGLERPARLVLPAGPHPTRTGGRSWFAVRTRAGRGIWLSEPELVASADRIAALVRAELKRRPTRGKPIVTGFSQGGILAFVLAVRHPDLFSLAVPVSGLLPEDLRPERLVPGLAYPRLRALHGAADELVPVAAARASVAHLQRLGLDASLEEFAGVGHRMPGPVRAALLRLLDQACDRAEPARP